MCRRPQRNNSNNNNGLRRLLNLWGNNDTADTHGSDLTEEQLTALFIRAEEFMDREGDPTEEEIDAFIDSLSEAEQDHLESIIDECLEEEFGSVSNYESLMQELENETREWEKIGDGAREALSKLPLDAQNKIINAYQNDEVIDYFEGGKPAGMSNSQWLNDCADRYEQDTDEWIFNLEKEAGEEAEIECDGAPIEVSDDLSNAIPDLPVDAEDIVKLDTDTLGQLLEEKRRFEEKHPEGDPEWKKDWFQRLGQAMDQINLQAEGK